MTNDHRQCRAAEDLKVFHSAALRGGFRAWGPLILRKSLHESAAAP